MTQQASKTSFLYTLSLALLFSLTGCTEDGREPRTAGARTALAADEADTYIRSFTSVAGTRFLMASLRTERERSSRSSRLYERRGYRSAATNYLFYNLDRRTARWLLPSNEQRILETHPLTGPDSTGSDASAEPSDRGAVRAFLYHVVRQDIDGDDDLDSDDPFALAASSAGGTGYAVLVEAADRLLGVFWLDANHTLLMVEMDGTVEGVEFDVEQRTVTRRVPLPATPDTASAT